MTTIPLPLYFFTLKGDYAPAVAPGKDGMRFPLAGSVEIAQVMAKRLWQPGPLVIRRFEAAADLLSYLEANSGTDVATVFLDLGAEVIECPIQAFMAVAREQSERESVAASN